MVLLGFIGVKNYRAVAGAPVRPLAVESGGVVAGEKHFKYLWKCDLAWVELNLHHLGVPGLLAADRIVGRINRVAAGIPGSDRRYAFNLGVNGFNAPEASATQYGNLIIIVSHSISLHQ